MDNDDIIRTIIELYERMNEGQRTKAIEKILERLQETVENEHE